MDYFFRWALLPDGWAENVRVTVDGGTVKTVVRDGQADTRSANHTVGLPGLTNVHSHAFQFAMAGLTEYRSARQDSFWSWRKLMYEFVARFTPDDVYAIGQRLYGAMRSGGYSTVVEFHYLMHQPDGSPYANVNAMADALISAAKDAGIRICLLPVYYQRGGFDDAPLAGGQVRFGSDEGLFLKMLDKLKRDWGDDDRVRLGCALHSLRAVSISSARSLLEQVASVLPECPVHIHVAEQVPEVDACLAAHGCRPVALLMNEFDVDHRWCLIHATHMDDDELERVARSGAVIGICPTTEANLGDGIFRAEPYMAAAGRWAVGSDSHIAVSAAAELRMLEYGQRLTLRRRAVLCNENESCGTYLWQRAAAGGGQVSGFGSSSIAVGNEATFAVIDADGSPTISGSAILDRAIFHEGTAGDETWATIRSLV